MIRHLQVLMPYGVSHSGHKTIGRNKRLVSPTELDDSDGKRHCALWKENAPSGLACSSKQTVEVKNGKSPLVANYNAIILDVQKKITGRVFLTDLSRFPSEKWSVMYKDEILTSNSRLKEIPCGPTNPLKIIAKPNESLDERKEKATIDSEDAIEISVGRINKLFTDLLHTDNLAAEEKAMEAAKMEDETMEKFTQEVMEKAICDVREKAIVAFKDIALEVVKGGSVKAMKDSAPEWPAGKVIEPESSDEELLTYAGTMKEFLIREFDRRNFCGGNGGLEYTVAFAQVSGVQGPQRVSPRTQASSAGGGISQVHVGAQITQRAGGTRLALANGGRRGSPLPLPAPVDMRNRNERSGPCRLKDLEGRRARKSGHYLPPNDDNAWMAFAPGFNVEGKCENPRCKSHKATDLPILRRGYGFSCLRCELSVCPACKQRTLKPATVLVSHARSLLSFKKTGVNVGGSTLMEHLGPFPEYVTPDDGNDEVEYDIIEVLTVRLNESPFICRWCDLAIRTRTSEVRKPCGHNFHQRCCSGNQNCRICSSDGN